MAPAPSAPAPKALSCSHCGAALTIRAPGQTVTVVCPHCLSVLDARDPTLKVLQEFAAKTRVTPRIPLGTRGKLRGEVYEVIGFQIRGITVEGIEYSWAEYLLFNPYQGFRYLTEYDGHWNDVRTLRSIPRTTTARNRPAVVVLGQTFKHFQTAQARTTYVLGEFPWEARVGDTARVEDFVAPPLIVSSETTEEETVWSLGEYIDGARIWEAFQLPGTPPPARGVYANQPSVILNQTRELWSQCGVFLLVLVLLAMLAFTLQDQREVFRRSFTLMPQPRVEPSLVTDVFELTGRPSDVELSIHTDVSNSWAYFDFALISEDTGQAYDFGREVSYYHGFDSDGSWTEGSPDDRVLIPTIPAGRYYLRIEPELDPQLRSLRYEVRLRRDVPASSFFLLAAVLLVVPPALSTWRSVSFESARWSESDVGGSRG